MNSLLTLLQTAPGPLFFEFLLKPLQPSGRPLLVVRIIPVSDLGLKLLDPRASSSAISTECMLPAWRNGFPLKRYVSAFLRFLFIGQPLKSRNQF